MSISLLLLVITIIATLFLGRRGGDSLFIFSYFFTGHFFYHYLSSILFYYIFCQYLFVGHIFFLMSSSCDKFVSTNFATDPDNRNRWGIPSCGKPLFFIQADSPLNHFLCFSFLLCANPGRKLSASPERKQIRFRV